MFYLALNPYGNTFKRAETLRELMPLLVKVSITDSGEIFVNGKLYPTSYNMQDYTKEEVLTDFANTSLRKIVSKHIEIVVVRSHTS